jgi:peptide/nickel transport system substrate-binding protein
MKSCVRAAAGWLVLAGLTTAPALAATEFRLDEAAPGQIDPAKGTDFAASVLAFNLYDTLVIPTAGKPGLQPHLAKSWTIDGNDYIFALRDDVKFHSGNPLTADDVVYSLHRLVGLGQGYSNLFADRVKEITAVDPHTVKFSLSGPYGPFVAALTRLQIVDSKLLKAHQAAGKYGENGDYAEAWLGAHDAGSGAYAATSHNPQEETDFVKFPGYFLGVPEKAPDKVRLRYGLEASTVRSLIARGEHDMASEWLPPEVIRALGERDDVQLLTERGVNAFYFKMNTTKAPLDDVHCRLAMTYAFDYGTAMKMLAVSKTLSLGSPANGPLPHGMVGSDDAPDYHQDMAKAKEEVGLCKSDKSIPIELSWVAEVPLEERFALLLQSNLTTLGLKSEVKRIPWALFSELATKAESTPHVSQLFNSPVTPDPDTLLYNMYHSAPHHTWQSTEYLNDAEVDKLLDASRSETDPEKRVKIFHNLNARLRALAATIYAYDQVEVFATRKVVSVPALSDDSQRYALGAFGKSFRFMEMK